jgi:hypothetical protein
MKKILLYLIGCMVVTGGAWAALQDGLVGYWPMNGDFKDATGNGHDGTVWAGATIPFGSGILDQAMVCNGTSPNGINTGTWVPSAGTDKLSISVWFKYAGQNSGWQGIVAKRNGYDDTNPMMWCIEIGNNNDTVSFFDVDSWPGSFVVAKDKWEHMVVSFDGTTATLYHNGTVAASGGFNLGPKLDANVVIGSSDGWNGFNGAIDEVAIWNRPLSAQDVAEIYNGGNGKSLAGEKWQAVYMAPVDKAKDIPMAGTKLQWTTSPDPAPKPIVRYDIYLGDNYAVIAEPNILARTATVGPTVFEYNSGALKDNTTYYWRIDTVVDDVNIAFGQVNSFQTVVMTPIITQQPGNVSVGPGGWPVSFTVAATSNDGTISYKWFKKGSATVLSTTSTLNLTATAGTQGQYYCELTNAYSTAPVVSEAAELTIVPRAPAGLTAGMVGYWPLDNNGADGSGNGLNGTVTGNTTFVTAKIGGGASLDGIGDFVQIPNNAALDLTEAMTVATWAKTRGAWRYGWESIVCNGENSWRLQRDGSNRGIEWALGYWETYGGSFGPKTIDDSQWHLIVGMTDGTTEKLFVDGVLDAQHTTIGTPPIQVQANKAYGMRIGSNPENTARDFDGWLDETVVWNRALTDTEIAALFNGGQGVALVNPWQPTGPTPADGSAGVNNAVDLTLMWQLGKVPPFGAQYQVFFGEFGEALTPSGTTTNQQLTLSKTVLDHDKKYSWRVDTTYQGTTETGQVWSFETIKLLPQIVTNPVNTVVPDGGTASFSFEVTSPTTVTYKWFKQESGLQVGTGNPLVLTNVNSASEGYYYCEATNFDGTTRSSSASLMLEQLLAYWKMDETVLAGDTGALIKDSTIFMHDGTKFGEVHSVEGSPYLGNAMAFDGAGDYIDTGTWNPHERSSQFTISMWVKWAGLNGQYQGLIAKRDGWGANLMMWSMDLNIDTGALGFIREGSYPPGTGALPIGQWAFVAVTFDGTNVTIYRDGRAVASGAFSLGFKTDARLIIGSGEANGGNPFNGALDDVRIYNYALDALEVAHLFTKDEGTVCMGNPAHDLDGNCRVGLNDVALFAAEWMKCNLVPLSACQ